MIEHCCLHAISLERGYFMYSYVSFGFSTLIARHTHYTRSVVRERECARARVYAFSHVRALRSMNKPSAKCKMSLCIVPWAATAFFGCFSNNMWSGNANFGGKGILIASQWSSIANLIFDTEKGFFFSVLLFDVSFLLWFELASHKK